MDNIETENGQFIMFCVINGDNVEYKATNMIETYAETLNIREVMNRVKELNKRIRFDQKAVLDTLTQQQPEDEIWLDQHDDTIKGLKLKYTIRNCPFNFNFYLKKQAEEEHKVSLLVPLFRTISSLNEQIIELKDAVQRKDIEIQQYKKEGSVLKRTTVATSIFDFDDFNNRYDECNQLAEVLEPIGEHFIEQLQNNAKIGAVSHSGIVMVEDNCVSPKKSETHKKEQNNSPKNRKRNAMARKQNLINRQLLTRKQNLDYESSQSFSQNSVNSDVEKVEAKPSNEREDVKLSPRRKRKVTGSTLAETVSADIVDELRSCTTQTKKVNANKPARRESNSLYLSEDEINEPKSPVRKRRAPQVSSSTTSTDENTDEDKQRDIEAILINLQELNKKRLEDLKRNKQDKK